MTALPHDCFYWHCHHRILVEFVTNPNERIDYIKADKPAHEIPIRLKWFRPVKGKLPAKVVKTGAAYDKAGAVYDKAWAVRDKAWVVYDKARAAYVKAWAAHDKARAAHDKALAEHKPALEALHAKECPSCPWDGDSLVFPDTG